MTHWRMPPFPGDVEDLPLLQHLIYLVNHTISLQVYFSAFVHFNCPYSLRCFSTTFPSTYNICHLAKDVDALDVGNPCGLKGNIHNGIILLVWITTHNMLHHNDRLFKLGHPRPRIKLAFLQAVVIRFRNTAWTMVASTCNVAYPTILADFLQCRIPAGMTVHTKVWSFIKDLTTLISWIFFFALY